MTQENEDPPPDHCGRPMRTSYEQRDKWWCAQCGTRRSKAEALDSVPYPVIDGIAPSWSDIELKLKPTGGGVIRGDATIAHGSGGSAMPQALPRTPTEVLDLIATTNLAFGAIVRHFRDRNPGGDALALADYYGSTNGLHRDMIDRVLTGGDP